MYFAADGNCYFWAILDQIKYDPILLLQYGVYDVSGIRNVIVQSAANENYMQELCQFLVFPDGEFVKKQ